MWKILEYVGLTKLQEDSSNIVHLRVSLLALIYQEFCERCGYRDPSYMRSLQKQHYLNIFENPIEVINEDIYKIIRALTDYYGEEAIFRIAFESMYRGISGSCFEWEVSKALDEVMEAVHNFGHAEQRAYRFLADGDDVTYFESCGGLGYF